MGIDTDNVLPNIKQVRSRLESLNIQKEPQRAYQWEFSLNTKELHGDFLHNLRFYGKTTSIPETGIDPIRIRYMGKMITYPGMSIDSQEIIVNFWDDENLTVTGYMRAWINMMSEVNTGRSVGKKNAAGVELSVKLKDRTDLITNADFKLTNAFPLKIGEISLTYDSSDVIEVPVTFAYDEIILLE